MIKKRYLFGGIVIVGLVAVLALAGHAKADVDVLPGGTLTGTLGPWGGIGQVYTTNTYDVTAGSLDIYFYDVDCSLLTYDNNIVWNLATKGQAAVGVTAGATITSIDPPANSVWIDQTNQNMNAGGDWSGKPTTTLGPDLTCFTIDDTRHYGFQDWYLPSVGGKVNNATLADPFYNTESYVTPNPRYPGAPAHGAPYYNTFDLHLRLNHTSGTTYTYEMWVRYHNSAAKVEGAGWVYTKAVNTVGPDAAWRKFTNAAGTISVFTVTGIDLTAVHPFVRLGNYVPVATHTLTWGTIIVIQGGACVSDAYVDDDHDGYTPGWNLTHFDTIQGGVDAACSGGVVHVAAGTYNEQVTINKPLTLQGAGEASTIIDGTGLGVPTLVSIPSATGDVTFDGFTVQNANDYQIVLSGGATGATIIITNNTIIGNGASTGIDYGLYGANGLSTVLFRDNTVMNCDYHSFFLERWQGATEVSYNTIITGTSSAGPAIGFMTYENPADLAGSKDVTTKQWVHHNDIDANAGSGILFMAPYGTYYNQYKGGSYTNIEISNNTIYNIGDYSKGIQLEVDGNGGGIYGVLITDNTISAMNPGVGTSRGIRSLARASDMTIIRNTISGFYRGVFQSYSFSTPGTVGPTGNEVHYNNFIGCIIGAENQYTTIANILNAECNWWGDASGPSGSGPGTGASVSTNVDFLPWLDRAYPSGNCVGGSCADPVYVDDNAAPSWYDWEHVATIQTAINRVCDGGIIYVAAGTYSPFKVEGFTIGLTILGTGMPVVTGAQTVRDMSYPANVDNVVYVNNSQNVDIIGLYIQGTNAGPNPRDFGVFYQHSSGMLQDCHVDHNTWGNMAALAVRAITNSTLTIENCTIEDYGRIAVYARSGTYLYVYNSTLIGTTYTMNDGDYVNYGIELEDLGYASYAVIKWNEIYDHDFDETYGVPTWSSAAILIDSWRYYGPIYGWTTPCSAEIWYNDIHDNYYGIEAIANDNIQVHYNNIYDNQYYGAVSECDYNNVYYTLAAENNFWGHLSGPYHPLTNPTALGNEVTDNVSYNPWLDDYYPDDDYANNQTSLANYSIVAAVSGTATVNAPGADSTTTVTTTVANTVTIINYLGNPEGPLPANTSGVAFIDIDVSNPGAVTYPIYLQMNYTTAELAAAGVGEMNLAGIAYWDDATTSWVLCANTGINYNDFGGYAGYGWAYLQAGELSPKTLLGYVQLQSDFIVTLDPNGYFVPASTFHINVVGAGAWKIFYKVDGVLFQGEWNTPVRFQINEVHGYQSGPHTVEYWAVSAGSYIEPHHTEIYVLDEEGPEVDIYFEGIAELTTGGRHQITPLTHIGFTAVDDQVGVDKIMYRLDGDLEWIGYVNLLTLSEGLHTVSVAAWDTLGNICSTMYTIQVGGGEPTTALSLSPEAPTGDNGWYVTAPVTVTLSASDEVSGVAHTLCRIDGGVWQAYTAPFEVGEGVHTVEYYSVDNVGLAEQVKQRTVSVDLYAPQITLEHPKKSWVYIFDRAIMPRPGNREPLIIGGITISARMQDTMTSGLSTTKLFVDGVLRSEGTTETVSYVLDETMFGEHMITIEASDVAGNTIQKEFWIRIFNLNL